MGLKETFEQAAVIAIKAFGNVRIPVDYKQISSSYNSTTGVVTQTTLTASLKVIVSDYESDEIDGNVILGTDQRMLIPAKDLKVNTFETLIIPEKGDTVEIYSTIEPMLMDAVTWQVINIQTDPAKALWIIQIRKP